MSKKVIVYSIMLMLLFSLSAILANAQFKEGTCKSPDGANYCGQKSRISNCYCDNKCTGYKDCCLDFKEVCPGLAAIPSAGGGSGGGGGGGGNLSTTTCKDSDGGKNYYVKGEIKGFFYYENKSGTQKDYCYDEKNVNEFYCDYQNVLNFIKECPNGCQDGACIQTQKCQLDSDCPPISCITTPCPQNKCVNNMCTLVNDGCGNGVCEKGEASECPQCVNSVPPCKAPCIIGTCPSDCQSKCKDSDGGKNYYVKGTSSDYFTPVPVKDVCSDDGINLVEYSCTAKDVNGNIILNKELFACPNGCQNGACLRQKFITKQNLIEYIEKDGIGAKITKEEALNYAKSKCNGNFNPLSNATTIVPIFID